MTELLADAGKVPRTTKKSDAAFRTISEVSSQLDVPSHVLRFWETRFTQVKPLKRGGGRRYYRPEDVTLLRRIRSLLYDDGYTIKGVQKILREGGARAKVAASPELPLEPSPLAAPNQVNNSAKKTANAQPALSLEKRTELEDILGELRSLRKILDQD
jgi:DNA-binding transcriptional MerR regulator